MICPCCSQHDFSNCCQPFLLKDKHPTTPEQLMRSRYTAFVSKNAKYLQETCNHTYNNIFDKEEDTKNIEASFNNRQWLGLIIHSASINSQNTNTGTVVFSAFYCDTHSSSADPQLKDKRTDFQQLHEKSEFIFKDKRWFYTTGDILPNYTLSRNESCFCQSHKKFKRCHGA